MSLAPTPKFRIIDDRAVRIYRPLISQGQVFRVLLLALFACAAWLLLADPSGAAEMPDPSGFAAFRTNIWREAARHGVSRATFDAAFEGVAPDPAILAKTTRQPEVTKTVAQYLAGVVTPERIATGRAEAEGRRAILDRIETRFGTDGAIVLGVWGIESNFGARTGDISTIRALATLAFAHYRGDYFRRELLDALDILQAGHVTPDAMRGSWAGAMGQTQFMPSSFKRYAIDFDGDGRKDIWRNVPDALGSTAAYLARHGWHTGESWGYEVLLPAAGEPEGGAKSFAAWAARGVARADGGAMPRTGEATLLRPAGPDGPAFLVTHNFKVIKSYNNSTSYALAVALLGDRIAGWGPLKTPWPVAAR
jgi:membrane-bound lytic murein transglycosylase B